MYFEFFSTCAVTIHSHLNLGKIYIIETLQISFAKYEVAKCIKILLLKYMNMSPSFSSKKFESVFIEN